MADDDRRDRGRHARMLLLALEWIDLACPRCGRAGRCGATEHANFLANRITFRCEGCRHAWSVPLAEASGLMPRCSGCGNEPDAISKDFLFEQGVAAARCDACNLIGVLGHDGPWFPPDRGDEMRAAAVAVWDRRRGV